MTSGQMGLVLGAWQLVFIGTASLLGSMIDCIGVRRAMALGLALLLSMLLRGLAVNFPSLLLSVALFGAGGPLIASSMPKVVAQWFRGNERGPATGVCVVGRDLGSVLALSTAASVVVALMSTPWRGISVVYGAVILVALVAWTLLARDAPPDEQAPSTVASVQERSSVRQLLAVRNVQVVLALGFAVFLLNHALQSWLPTSLQESGFTLEASGRLVALGLVAAMATNFFVPSFTRQGYRGPMLAGMLASSAAITAGLVFASGGTLVALVAVGSMIRFPALQLLTLVLMDTPEVGMRRLATTTGIFFTVAEVGGFTGPLTMGLVRDATGDLTGGVLALAVVTAAMAPLPLLLRERRG